MKCMRQALVLAVLVLAPTLQLRAQSTATLSGTVTDPSGAVVPGAAVTIRETATGAERNTASDSAGSFTAPSLHPGDYTVTVVAPGFSKFTVQKITLEVNATPTINAKLALESAGETVQVEGARAVIEAETVTVGTGDRP